MSGGAWSLDEIEVIAAIAHDANRRLCRVQGDDSQPLWEGAPAWQRESAVAGVRAILEGRVRRPEDSHHSWTRDKLRAGWAYGTEKDADRKLHPCLVPFEQLPFKQQLKDHLFFGIVTALLSASGWVPPSEEGS